MYKKISKYTNSGIVIYPVKTHLDGIVRSIREGLVRDQKDFYSALYALYHSSKNIIQYKHSNICLERSVQLPSRVSDAWSDEQLIIAFSEIAMVFDSVRNVLQSDVFSCPATLQ